ncbi:M56 family metallopeptidase [Pseudoxanthomonas daejeonensis]|uniref:Peptidase M56 n=1 Tax=Pseudoxanthomonas daejeonensis TaxID=266062 RepID=A0ABQ6Z6B7_9GAMM|nr:M56 family metallopeptidase [Pseudoxanthomonas daejeonensis]KAF1694085.1 peptidase M56 [Pseudoxanthomonas daejeonensis]
MHEQIAELVPVLGRALLHFLWQGGLIGLLSALALQLLRNARPQLRYAVACLALLACVLLPMATVAWELADMAPGGPADMVPLAGLSAAPAAAFAGPALLAGPAEWGVDALLPWIVAAWAAGACALSLRMAAGVWWVYRLPLLPLPHIQQKWQQRVDALVARCGVRRTVTLRLVDEIDTPAAVGWWRPMVLLPVSLLSRLPADYLEALLAHELAHVRRHDYLVNLLQGLAEALLFYHPVTWWLSRRIRDEREHVADRIAAEAMGDPRRLALALAALADARTAPGLLPQPALAALGNHRGHLMSRIENLVRPGRVSSGGRLVFPLIGLAAAGLAFYAHAQRDPQASVAPAITLAPAAVGVLASPSAAPAPAPRTSTTAQAAPVAKGTRASTIPAPPAPPAPPAAPAAPVAPTLKAPPAPPAPPTPSAGKAPPAPPAPPAPVIAGMRQHGTQGEPYALVRKGSDGYLMSGSSDDMPQIETVRRSVDGDFLWFRRGGKDYVVTDPATVARVRKSWAEADVLSERMRALSQDMEGHGRKMEAIGREMEKASGDMGPPPGFEAVSRQLEALGREQGELGERQARLSLALADASADRDVRRQAELQDQMQVLEREQAALSKRMETQSRKLETEAGRHQQRMQPMEALSRQMEQASLPMEALGRQMDGLGKQMDQVSQRAERDTRNLIAESLEKGLAKPSPQRQ